MASWLIVCAYRVLRRILSVGFTYVQSSFWNFIAVCRSFKMSGYCFHGIHNHFIVPKYALLEDWKLKDRRKNSDFETTTVIIIITKDLPRTRDLCRGPGNGSMAVSAVAWDWPAGNHINARRIIIVHDIYHISDPEPSNSTCAISGSRQRARRSLDVAESESLTPNVKLACKNDLKGKYRLTLTQNCEWG
jgi:hypothetical protein